MQSWTSRFVAGIAAFGLINVVNIADAGQRCSRLMNQLAPVVNPVIHWAIGQGEQLVEMRLGTTHSASAELPPATQAAEPRDDLKEMNDRMDKVLADLNVTVPKPKAPTPIGENAAEPNKPTKLPSKFPQ